MSDDIQRRCVQLLEEDVKAMTTPRTDALLSNHAALHPSSPNIYNALVGHARQLERDLAAAKSERDAALDMQKAYFDRCEQFSDDLAAAQEALRIAGEKAESDARLITETMEGERRAEERAEANAKDAQLGQILMRYIDRLDDPVPDDALPDIVAALIKDAIAAIAREGK